MEICRSFVDQVGEIQARKRNDYGPSWWVFRFESLVEKIYIKAKRIRTVQAKQENRVGDSIEEDLLGVFSYAVFAIAKFRAEEPDVLEVPETWRTPEASAVSYSIISGEILDLLAKKNHDYGEAWRELSPATMVDEILARTVRITHLLQHGDTHATAIEDQLFDIANYALLLLVRQRELAA